MKVDTDTTTFETEITSMLPSMKENAQQIHNAQAHMVFTPQPARSITKDKSTDFNVIDLQMAIRDIEDMSEKTMINFICLGDLAKAIKDKDDTQLFPKVEIGMREKQLTPEIKSLFKTWGFEETKYGYKYNFTPPIKWDVMIPVEIHVIKRHYKFFEHLDTGFYGVDNFYIPNPFDSYWKVRKLIR